MRLPLGRVVVLSVSFWSEAGTSSGLDILRLPRVDDLGGTERCIQAGCVHTALGKHANNDYKASDFPKVRFHRARGTHTFLSPRALLANAIHVSHALTVT